MSPPSPRLIYKVLSRDEYAAAVAAGVFTGSGADRADGFVHFSTASQLPETLRRHYAGRTGLVVLAVAAAPLGEALRWEPSRGGELFPHLYDDLPLSAVAAMGPIATGADGNFELPDIVR